MPSMRHIKQRIRSVKSTQQITNAMKLVAASKLQKAKQSLEATRPFFGELQRVIGEIVGSSSGLNHPLLTKRSEVKNTLVIVITSDRGLCGGYNANICKEALSVVNKANGASLYIVGNKGRDYFVRRKKNIFKVVNGLSENPFYEDAAAIGRAALDMFVKGEVDEVYLAYTEFKSTITHDPKVARILPLDASDFEGAKHESGEGKAVMGYEPDEDVVLTSVIPWYIESRIFSALVESTACEQGARMTSMDSATENAEEMISTLTLVYNRARQGAITQEITEIVAGANASG